MKTYLNTETGLLALTAAATQGIRQISAKRGDAFLLEVIPSAALGEGATGKFCAKSTYSGDPVALDAAWSEPATEGAGYLFALSLNTTELNALFTEETASVTLLAEITWEDETGVHSTQTFSLVVARDVWRGDEGVPTDATPEYPLPGALVLLGAVHGEAKITAAGLEIQDTDTGVWRRITFANGQLTFTEL